MKEYEYKVKLTALEIHDLKNNRILAACHSLCAKQLMEDKFNYEGALILGIVDQIINQDETAIESQIESTKNKYYEKHIH